jgi:hypothetical protein
MTVSKRTSTKDHEALQALKKENAALRKKLRAAEQDSEAYRKACQAWATNQITPAELKAWDRPVKDSGRTILDVIKDVKSTRKPRRRA